MPPVKSCHVQIQTTKQQYTCLSFRWRKSSRELIIQFFFSIQPKYLQSTVLLKMNPVRNNSSFTELFWRKNLEKTRERDSIKSTYPRPRFRTELENIWAVCPFWSAKGGYIDWIKSRFLLSLSTSKFDHLVLIGYLESERCNLFMLWLKHFTEVSICPVSITVALIATISSHSNKDWLKLSCSLC